ncbi:predicted protein [Naegleria gruberi]|uniref:Predicted protein n=1 Tax=Naegleria gruberi TaxID=5762 RepID=D2W198_NAEGR|nr:uncharacterized protein NAEGRDRAFT_75141 [Naegleria gruberi]EFC37146.1 predicted protein [Naegleria gruberi]|eukprot:XP_002669890.1 predicted protein [Naegleria gruberi strain NEG-M]
MFNPFFTQPSGGANVNPSNVNGSNQFNNSVAGTYNSCSNSSGSTMPNLFSDMINVNRRMMMGGFSMPSVNFGMTVMGQSSTTNMTNSGMLGGGMIMPSSKTHEMCDLSGKWQDKSGMVWHITQNGNTFQMIEERSNFTGKGSVISSNINGTEWVIHVSLTARTLQVNNRLQAFDNNMLVGQRDFFKLIEKFNTNVKPSPNNVIDPNLSLKLVGSSFKSKSGEWQVVMKLNEGLYAIKNGSGIMKHLCITPDNNGQLMVFISQENKSGKGEEALFCLTADISHLSLSNGEVWTLEAPPTINSHVYSSIYQQPQTYSQPGYPMYQQPPTQPNYYPPNNSYPQPPNLYQQQPFNPYPPQYGHHHQPQPNYYPPNNSYVPPPQTVSPPPKTIGWVESILACKDESSNRILEKIDQYSKSQYEKCESHHLKQILKLLTHGPHQRDAISLLSKNLAIGYLTCSSVATDIVPCFDFFSHTFESITTLAPQITDRRQNAEVICKCFNDIDAKKVRELLMK